MMNNMMKNKTNKELEMMELNDEIIENVVGGASNSNEPENSVMDTLMWCIPIYGIYWAYTHRKPKN